MPNSEMPQSPPWSSTTKLLVGLTAIALIVTLVVYFHSIIGPLLLAFILAYVLHPIAAWIDRRTRLSWRASVLIVFLALVFILLTLLALVGIALVQQVQSLLGIFNLLTENFPQQVEELSHQVVQLGPFQLNMNQYDLGTATNQVLSTLQPTLVRLGALVSGFATSAFVTLGWGAFVLVIAYFLLAEAGQVRSDLIQVDIPGHNVDIHRLSQALSRIWQVFLRGQLAIFFLAIFLYTILLTFLGVRYSLAIAIMAGLARFIPYVGPFIVWVTLTLVALLQGHNYFGLQTWAYALLVLGLAIVLDQILDNLVVPMFHGETLGVHPAAVLIAAIVAANLIGFVGLVLAAPVLASLVLFGRYISRKLLDLDPWPSIQNNQRAPEFPWKDMVERTRIWWQRVNHQ